MIQLLLSAATSRPPCRQIRFASLFRPGRALCFPCDAEGHVDLDTLSEQARNNYLIARALVGREYASPCVGLMPG